MSREIGFVDIGYKTSSESFCRKSSKLVIFDFEEYEFRFRILQIFQECFRIPQWYVDKFFRRRVLQLTVDSVVQKRNEKLKNTWKELNCDEGLTLQEQKIVGLLG